MSDEYPNDIHKVPGGIILSSTVDGLRKYDPDGKLLWSFNFFNNVYDGFSIALLMWMRKAIFMQLCT